MIIKRKEGEERAKSKKKKDDGGIAGPGRKKKLLVVRPHAGQENQPRVQLAFGLVNFVFSFSSGLK